MNKVKLLPVLLLFISLQGMSQENTPSDGKVGKAVNKAGNKTAEIAAKGAAGLKDKKYDSKVGPKGQTIFIDNNDHYYYVNGRGKKVYVTKSKLKDKSE